MGVGGIESKSLGAGDICIIPPLLGHEVRWINCAHFVNFHIAVESICGASKHAYDKEADVFSVQIGVRDPFVFHLGQSIKQMVMLEKTDNDKYYDAVITMLANYLVNNYLIQEEQAIAFDSFEKLPCEKLRSAILFMSNNINRNLRIQEIAAEINASQYHFIRVFKEKMGISPNKYHMIQRIEKAKKLLIRQDKIIDVANNLGFSSQSHFSSVFTKTVGITPLKFQQQY